MRYLDFFCRLSVTDARMDLSSLSERAKQGLVSVRVAGRKANSNLLALQLRPVSQGQLSMWGQELPVTQPLTFAKRCARHFCALSHVSLQTALRNR